MSKSRGRGGKGNGKRVARVGAAAFALGLSLAGPQVGSAAADATEDGSTASSNSRSTASASSGSDSAKASSPRAGRPQASVPRRGTKAARSVEQRVELADVPAGAGERASDPAAAVSAPRAAAAAREDRGAGADGDPGRAVSAAAAGPAPSAAVMSPADSAVAASSAAASAVEPVTAAPATPAAVAAATSTGGIVPAPDWAAAAAAATTELAKSCDGCIEPPFPEAPNPLDTLHSGVQSFFIKAQHFLANLQVQGGPLGALGANLEGLLLVVRTAFFNQRPTLNPFQKSATQSGQLTGTVGGYDAEGETLTYSILDGPRNGTVTLTTGGKYMYTPGAGYLGSDQFVVAVASDGAGVNLFNLGQGKRQITTATVTVGDTPTNNPLTGLTGAIAGSVPPLALFLDTPVTVETDGSGNPSVLLTVKDTTQLTWQRPGGANGTVSVADVVKQWNDYASAAGDPEYLFMGVDFTLPEGTQVTALINNVKATKSGDTYTFTGKFLDLTIPPADTYDIIGAGFETSYNNFRNTYGGGIAPAKLDLDISTASVYISNYTLQQYNQAMAGTDLGVTPTAPPPVVSATASTTTVGTSKYFDITAILPDGVGGFFDSTGQGVVTHHRSDGSVVDLTAGVDWKSPVREMISYGGRAIPVYTLVDAKSDTKDASTAVTVPGFPNSPRLDLLLDTALPLLTDGTGRLDMTKVQPGSVGGQVTYGGNTYDITADSFGTLSVPGDTPAPVFVQAVTPGATTKITLQFNQPVNQLVPGPVSMNLGYGLQTGQTVIPGLVVGLGNGAIQQWTPGDPADPSQAAGSWRELQNDGWNSAVNVLLPYKGRPDVCAGGCDGFLVGLNNGSVQQYNEARNGAGQAGWYELQGSGWGSAVRGMVLSKTDSADPPLPLFAVGLQNGAVEQWNGSGWQEMQPPGKKGWNTTLNTIMEYGDGYVVGLDNGAVFQFNNDTNAWSPLQDTGWNSAVNTMVPYGAGFAVGLDNGAIEHWTGSQWVQFQVPMYQATAMTPYGSLGLAVGTGQCGGGIGTTAGNNCNSQVYKQIQNGVNVWDGQKMVAIQGKNQLGDGTGWASTPTVMTQIGNDLVVGLTDGTLEIYDGTKWTAVKSNKLDLNGDTLQGAVEFAQGGGKVLDDNGLVADDGNIFYTQSATLMPTCFSSNSCDASFYPFTLKGADPYSLAGKEISLGANGQSLVLSYDIGSTDYGYIMVPNGVWKKLNPSKYAFAVLASVYTGPSITLDLGDDGEFSSEPVDLLNFDYTCNLVCSGGTGSYNVNVNVNAAVTGGLIADPETGELLTGEISGHSYAVPGMLIAYNAGRTPFQFGAGFYLDNDYSEFKQIKGLEIKPVITPSITLSWGLFTSPDTPIIGEQSLFDLNLGYENPLILDIDVTWGDGDGANASGSLTSTGDITYGAGILSDLFSTLTYEGSLQVYSTTVDLFNTSENTAANA